MSITAESNSAHQTRPAKTWIVLGVPCVLLLVGPAKAQWAGLRLAGSRDSLWVLFEARGREGLETRLWMRQRDRGFRRPKMDGRLGPDVVASAACGTDLHLFFKNGAHRRVGPHRVSPERILPGRVTPLYLVGDSPERSLYAIAEYQGTASSLPATTTSPGSPELGAAVRARTPSGSGTATGPAPGWALYRFARRQWTVFSVLPGWFDPDDQHWMWAENGQVHLFGLGQGPDAPVWYRRGSSERWDEPETVPVPSNSNPLAAMVVNTYLVLVTWTPAGRDRSNVVALQRIGDRWERAELLAASGEPLALSSDRLRVGAFNEKIAMVGQFTRARRLQVGFWSPSGGPPEGPLRPLPKWREKTESPWLPKLPEIALFAIVAGVIVLTLWRRQESLTREVRLPAQVALASIWRRLAAFFLDIAPAVAVTAVYWLPQLTQLQQELRFEELGDAEEAQRYAVLLWPWLAIRVIYAVYCGLTEYRWNASPGKRLMQCWVVGSDLRRPRPKQIAIRNLLKILELQPEIVAVLIFIVLTRNHQRLGDLLAGTLVVEPATPPVE